MHGRLVLIATFGTVSVWTAQAAADDNFVNFLQLGNTHHGFVEQTGRGNQAGTTVIAITQTGFDDNLAVTQSGDNNTLGILGGGVLQNASVPGTNAAFSNSAVVVQNSSGNDIGEIMQTSDSRHPTVANSLTVTQDLGDFNTIISVRQTQAAPEASSNFARIVETGIHNWLQELTQNATSFEGDNTIFFQAAGNYNGLNGTQSGAGTLAVLAQSSGAAASRLVQRGDSSGGSANTLSLIITGDFNQFGMEQDGADNSAGVTVTGLSNSFGSLQMGRHNQITTGGMAGDGNDMGVRQVGYENSASAVLQWSSSDNRIGLGQSGDHNQGNINLKGDRNLVGLSQLGRGNTASISADGIVNVEENVVVVLQANTGETGTMGNEAAIAVNGDRNNADEEGHAPSFSEAALDIAATGPAMPGSLQLAPDAGSVLGPRSLPLTVPGTLLQWGDGNRLEVTVGALAPASDNLFAALQVGQSNTLVASVDGSFNQFVVFQNGDQNISVVNQDGAGNKAAISQ